MKINVGGSGHSNPNPKHTTKPGYNDPYDEEQIAKNIAAPISDFFGNIPLSTLAPFPLNYLIDKPKKEYPSPTIPQALAGGGPNQKAAWKAQEDKLAAQMAAYKAAGSQRPEYNSQVPGVNGHYTYDPNVQQPAGGSTLPGMPANPYYDRGLAAQMAGLDAQRQQANADYKATVSMLKNKYNLAETKEEKKVLSQQLKSIEMDFRRVQGSIRDAVKYAEVRSQADAARSVRDTERAMADVQAVYAAPVERTADTAVANAIANATAAGGQAQQADIVGQRADWQALGSSLANVARTAGIRGVTESELFRAGKNADTSAQHYASVSDRINADRRALADQQLAAAQARNATLSGIVGDRAAARANYYNNEGQRLDAWTADQQPSAAEASAAREGAARAAASKAAASYVKGLDFAGVQNTYQGDKGAVITFNPAKVAQQVSNAIASAPTYDEALSIARNYQEIDPTAPLLSGVFDPWAVLEATWAGYGA